MIVVCKGFDVCVVDVEDKKEDATGFVTVDDRWW